MDGILVQTTRSIRASSAIATEGAPADKIDLAYHALLDQCAAAEREALRTPPDPIARFDARAAAVRSVAYRPVLRRPVLGALAPLGGRRARAEELSLG